MPRSSGLEVLVGFLHVRPNLASLVYTSFVTKAVENKAYAYGAFAVLTKPSAGATVAAAVRDALTAKQKDQLKKIA
ncbi:MAG: hypothetical protein KDD62_10620, partial [Bdellovibrionales bacterium]|nr:hypothetical protein [Bdellovibrionales bacterium]